jgi:probable rRNA maturation factor
MKKSATKRRDKTLSIAVIIEDPQWREKSPAIARLLRRAVAASLKAARAQAKSRLTILLGSDARLRKLNGTFRGKNAATNVLSFPAQGDAHYLGDVAIAYGVTAREAAAASKSFADHAAHLAVHGTLHLLGYDHVRAREAGEMENLERRILAGLGIADPYAAREAA